MIKIKQDERIDWFKVLIDLHYKGLSFASISRKINIPASTIKTWKYQTGRPKFEEALRLIEFWCEKTGNAPSDIPVANHYKA